MLKSVKGYSLTLVNSYLFLVDTDQASYLNADIYTDASYFNGDLSTDASYFNAEQYTDASYLNADLYTDASYLNADLYTDASYQCGSIHRCFISQCGSIQNLKLQCVVVAKCQKSSTDHFFKIFIMFCENPLSFLQRPT